MMSRIIPFAAILIAISLFFGYMKPTWQNEVAEVKQDITTYDKALTAARQFNEQLVRLQNEQNQIPPEQLERLRVFLPDGVDNIQLILDLTQLAERAGVDLLDFETPQIPEVGAEQDGEIGSSSTVESLTITVNIEGTYDDFRTFLEAVERSLRPLDVREIVIANSETGVYTYQLTMEFYWLR